MYKQTATNLCNLPADELKKWLDSFDTVLTDCDGVLWVYNDVIEGSPAVINKLKELGKKVYFVTNNSTKTRSEFLEKSDRMGFKMTKDEIISTAYVAAAYLKNLNFNKKVYVIGTVGVAKELTDVGIECIGCGPDVIESNLLNFVNQEVKRDENVGAVIVAFDEHFSFPKMTKAASYLNDPKCLFIATNTDERFPMNHFVLPGTGSIVKAIETCSERQAIVMGKPNPYICETLLREKKIIPERTLMIGDRCNTDVLLGWNCGFQTLLVETGIHKMKDVKCWMTNGTDEEKRLIPDVFLPKLGDLHSLL